MAEGWKPSNSCTSLSPHLAGWPQTAPACRAQSARGCAVHRRPWCCPTRSAQSRHRAWGGAGGQVGLRKQRGGWTCHTPPSPRNSACGGGSGGRWPAHPTSWRGHRPCNLAHCALTIFMRDGDGGAAPACGRATGRGPPTPVHRQAPAHQAAAPHIATHCADQAETHLFSSTTPLAGRGLRAPNIACRASPATSKSRGSR